MRSTCSLRLRGLGSPRFRRRQTTPPFLQSSRDVALLTRASLPAEGPLLPSSTRGLRRRHRSSRTRTKSTLRRGFVRRPVRSTLFAFVSTPKAKSTSLPTRPLAARGRCSATISLEYGMGVASSCSATSTVRRPIPKWSTGTVFMGLHLRRSDRGLRGRDVGAPTRHFSASLRRWARRKAPIN